MYKAVLKGCRYNIYKACDLETGELSVVFEKRGDFPTARLETEEDTDGGRLEKTYTGT